MWSLREESSINSRGQNMPRGGAELRRKAGEAASARDRQAAAASQDEADESDATEEEATGGRTTRVGRPRGGMIHEGCSENRRGTAKGDRKRQTTKAQGLGWATASTTLLSLKSLCGGGVPSSHPSLGFSILFLFSKILPRSVTPVSHGSGTPTSPSLIVDSLAPPTRLPPNEDIARLCGRDASSSSPCSA